MEALEVLEAKCNYRLLLCSRAIFCVTKSSRGSSWWMAAAGGAAAAAKLAEAAAGRPRCKAVVAFLAGITNKQLCQSLISQPASSTLLCTTSEAVAHSGIKSWVQSFKFLYIF